MYFLHPLRPILVLVIAAILASASPLALAQTKPAVEAQPTASTPPPGRSFLLESLDETKPGVVLVGNSMLAVGINYRLVSSKLGVPTSVVQAPGSHSVWQYGVLRYVLSHLEPKPRMVVVIERTNNFTDPQSRAPEFLPRVREMAGGEDTELVERLAAHGEGQPKRQQEVEVDSSLDGFFWQFPQAVRWSFLPHMIQCAKEGGYQLVIARHKSRQFAEKPDFYPPQMQKYREDMAYYLHANNVIFLDYERSPEIKGDMYANGDHLDSNGRDVWTDLMIEDLKALLAGKQAPRQYLPPEGYKPSDELKAVAEKLPQLPQPPPPAIATAMKSDAEARAKAAPKRGGKGDLTANQESILYFARGMTDHGITVVPVLLPSLNSNAHWVADMSEKIGRGGMSFDVSGDFARLSAEDRNALYLTPNTLSPKGVEFLAQALARQVREKFPFLDAPLAEYESMPTTVKQPDGTTLTIGQVRPRGGKGFVEQTHATRLVLIGDRNVGLYSDPALNTGEHAGLGEHLSKALGRPLQWHYRDKAPKDAIVELIKEVNLDQTTVVVWLLSAEEMKNGRWGPFPVPAIANRQQPERLVVQAKIVKPSPPPVPDLKEKYPDTVNYTLWEIEKVIEGDWPHKELLTVEWSQKDMAFLRPFHYEAGQEFKLELTPLSDASRRDRTIGRADRVDTIRRDDLPPFWITRHSKP